MMPMLRPARPPAILGSAITAPVANELVIVPAFMPTRPPSVLPSPPVTLPLALEFSIVPVLRPARPPEMLPTPPVTLPVAFEPVIEPALAPTRPPTPNVEPLTAPLADELTIEPPESFQADEAADREAVGRSSATDDCDPVISPELVPASPPRVLNVPPAT